jgi:hypothetical protein
MRGEPSGFGTGNVPATPRISIANIFISQTMFARGPRRGGVEEGSVVSWGYFVTAMDFRKSATLYVKNAAPTAATIANWGHTAVMPPPR